MQLFSLGIFVVLLIFISFMKRASLEGKAMMAFAALALSAFIRLHFYLLLFTALAIFAFVAVAFIWSRIASAGVTVSRKIKPEALVGESVPVSYSVGTHSILPLYHVRVWDRAYRVRSSGDEIIPFEDPGYLGFLRIGRNEKSDAILHVIPSVRGTLNFGPIAIEGGDPFGIFTPIRWRAVGDQCLVLPTWIRLSALPRIPARLGAREQDRLVTKEGQSHEFLGVRAYAEGDSLRRVHWPLTAKHDELVVRQFQREVEEEMLVILDADRIADIGEGADNAFEYLITLGSSIVHSASEMARPWTFIIAGTRIDTFTHKTKDALLTVQYALARLEAVRQTPIESFLDKIRKEYPNSACALLTPRTDAGPIAALAQSDGAGGLGGARSMVIRVDPNTFIPAVDDSLRAMKHRREISQQPIVRAESVVTAIPEFTLSRGESISELFLTRVLA